MFEHSTPDLSSGNQKSLERILSSFRLNVTLELELTPGYELNAHYLRDAPTQFYLLQVFLAHTSNLSGTSTIKIMGITGIAPCMTSEFAFLNR